MNEEITNFLRDLFMCATLLGVGEIQGIDFTTYNDGAILLNMHTEDALTRATHWHQLVLPGTTVQMLEHRLTSVPGTLVSSEE